MLDNSADLGDRALVLVVGAIVVKTRRIRRIAVRARVVNADVEAEFLTFLQTLHEAARLTASEAREAQRGFNSADVAAAKLNCASLQLSQRREHLMKHLEALNINELKLDPRILVLGEFEGNII